ncbi:hypothetical protein [Sphingobium yanoikuyae]|uniref:Uncharacterized protein n=1 Tax=Sphingobium yanoikuyae TaxID=13690 RepID=A0A3G2V1A1_SPHYA|nr:hypothetical protein [Sphingobium yanoikuyae]AYO80092.1 hypothetical protein EBF16_26435 [Sphingobium yanoikuyae]
MTIDLATRVVGPSEDIHIIQPGQEYWLYDRFKASKKVFLDFPGLELDFSKPPPADHILKRMVARSIALQEWYVNDQTGPRPSDKLDDYVGREGRRRLGRYVGAIKRVYWDLKPGAIVVVPGPHYSDDVLIGELVGAPIMYKNRSLYDEEIIPVRRVEWRRRKPRSAFKLEVRDKFGKPNPVTQLDRSLRVEILRAGFDQFVIDDEISVRLNTTKDDFNTLDDYNIQTFVNYVAGVLLAADLGYDKEIGFNDAIGLLRQHPDMIPELKLNINSIGFQRIVSHNVKPLVIAALLSAALAVAAPGSASPAYAAPVSTHVVNTAAPKNDDCTVQVSARVAVAMKLMKLDEWKRVCENAREASASTGLSTTMKVRQRKKAKP